MAVRQFPASRMSAPRYGWFVLGLVLVWGVGDAASTLLALGLGGTIELEANPLIRSLLSEHLLLLPLFKAAVVSLAGGALLACHEYVESVPGWRLWFTGVLSLGAVIVGTNVYVALTFL